MIWDFQVFTQIWIIRNSRPESDYFLMSIYSFVTSFNVSAVRARLGDRARDGAGHARRHVRLHPPDGADRGDRVSAAAAPVPRRRRQPPTVARRVALNLHRPARLRRDGLPGLLDGRDRVQAGQRRPLVKPQWFPPDPTLASFRDAIGRPYFWDDVQEQPDRRRRRWSSLVDRARVPRGARAGEVPLLRPQRVVHRDHLRGADGAAERADHPALHHAQPRRTRSTS